MGNPRGRGWKGRSEWERMRRRMWRKHPPRRQGVGQEAASDKFQATAKDRSWSSPLEGEHYLYVSRAWPHVPLAWAWLLAVPVDPHFSCFRLAGHGPCSEQGGSAEVAPEETEGPDLESSDETDHSSKVRFSFSRLPSWSTQESQLTRHLCSCVWLEGLSTGPQCFYFWDFAK